MLIALVVAAAVALAGVAVVVAARERARAERFRTAFERLEGQLAPLSRRIRESVSRTRSADGDRGPRLEDVLERIAADGSAVAAFRGIASELSPEAPDAHSASRRASSAYEVELEREIARAQRTGRPLSLVLIDVDEPTAERLLGLAALLSRVTRVTDTVCRRRRDAFGILLPETPEEGAHRFFVRVRDEAARTFAASTGATFSTSIVEWRTSETSEAFDARARAVVERRVRDLANPSIGA
jgi:GGDEF domain-containing protein